MVEALVFACYRPVNLLPPTLCAEVLLPDIHVDCPNSSFLSDICVLRPCTYYNKYIFSHYLKFMINIELSRKGPVRLCTLNSTDF